MADSPRPPRIPTALTALDDTAFSEEQFVSESTVGGDFTDYTRDGLVIERSRIVNARFVAATLRRAELTDVAIENTDLSGADLNESTLTRVVFRDCRMSGVILSQCAFSDVLITDCRLDDANFRMTQAKAVTFDDVDLRGGDFYAAQLEGARFFDCNLTGAEFSKATAPGARFHGSDLSGLKGGQDLAGAVISSSQVLALALSVLARLQIGIDDEREPAPSVDRKGRARRS
jgi:uncharacterized protein YjbI with pentapeptide repeats